MRFRAKTHFFIQKLAYIKKKQYLCSRKLQRLMIMSQKTLFKIQYINLCIDEFAHKFRLTPQVAHNYLSRYKGLEFLNEHYDYEHTQALWQTQEALRTICQRNGGTL